MKPTHKGFTLIELLVVIVILAIISTIGITIFRSASVKALDAQRKSDLRALSFALEIYLQKNNSYINPAGNGANDCTNDMANFYTNITPLIANQKTLKDPTTNSNYCYIPVNNGVSFRLFAKLENCSDPEVYNPSTCASDPYNFTIASQDLAIASASVAPTSTPTLTPTPLSYKRVFVTGGTTYNGDLKTAGSGVGLGTATDGLDGADKLCQSRANGLTPAGTFKAWLSSSTASASSRLIPAAIPYKSVNGTTPFANNWADLITLKTSNYLTHPISRDEADQPLGSTAPVWTNTDPSGISLGATSCSDWTSTTGNSYAGRTDQIDVQWTNWTSANCGNVNVRLYCFEQ